MAATLECRFKRFLGDLPGTEDLDSAEFIFPPNTAKADYLVYDRTVVVELKTLTVDPQPKIDARVDDYLRKTGAVIYGEFLTTQLFDDEAESDNFHKSLIYALTRNTEAICRDANKQLGSTKKFLDLRATSTLIILNENIQNLDPGIVGYRVAQYLNKEPREIDFCLLVFESHQIKEGSSTHDPMLCISSGDQSHRARRRMKLLMKAWAAFNGVPYTEVNGTAPESLDYVPRSGP